MKVWIWIIVIVIIGAGAWYLWSMGSGSATSTDNTAMTPTPTETTVPTQSGTSLQTSDNSDASLQTDAKMIDGQIQSSNDASAAVDQSFNDKPVQQSY